MKNIKEKGFALILSLVLLLAMSLMGGALILIASEDHRSNNLVDVNQQAFYVAEMALLQGERYLLDQAMGPWDGQTGNRDTDAANLPSNLNAVFGGEMFPNTNALICRNSFKDLPSNLQVIDLDPTTPASEGRSFNFGDFLQDSGIIDPADNDQAFLRNFHYEYFITRLGAAKFRGAGSSAKRGSGGAGSGRNGIAYRVYGCGIFNSDPNSSNQTIVNLESITVLPSS